MGWDAFATKKRNKKLFKEAAEVVIKHAGSVDGLLRHGGLDSSTCGSWLQSATGCDVYDEFGWTKEKVKVLNEGAEWPDPQEVDHDDLWAMFSAMLFLDVCAELGSGIRFSY